MEEKADSTNSFSHPHYHSKALGGKDKGWGIYSLIHIWRKNPTDHITRAVEMLLWPAVMPLYMLNVPSSPVIK